MVVQPHDLLWGLTSQHLPSDTPDWVFAVVETGQPVVVRRAQATEHSIAVGIRGVLKQQRFATFMPKTAIAKVIRPEQLIHVDSQQFPHIAQKIQCVYWQLQETAWHWGITGSSGFELATGIRVTHANSDLDILVRSDNEISKAQAQQLLGQLQQPHFQVDVQLQTPLGGVSLADWANCRDRVLLKASSGAKLVENPWYNVEVTA
ncbi:MAG: malonate decarboxylase holo-ACP synthase [Acinetobacter sp.]